ncbi:MAG: DUF4234 domain-containing protein [Synergistaceae bacterium]|nr:DUF4234 domain-containing protein [Synergistaceae bacterium]
MNCSGCGAPLEAGAEVCPYCGKMTAYGEEKFREREEHRHEDEKRKEYENLPQMKYVADAFIPVLYIFTLGLYSPYWYAVRMKSINGLNSEAKLPAWLAGAFALVMMAVFLVPSPYDADMNVTDENLQYISNVILSCVILLSGYIAYTVRRVFQEHASHYMERNTAIQSIAPSNVMLFLFGAAYLQYSVNRMIKMKILAPKI